jgi:hypothetical protein
VVPRSQEPSGGKDEGARVRYGAAEMEREEVGGSGKKKKKRERLKKKNKKAESQQKLM